MALLSTRHLLKRFGGVSAVDRVNLSFEAGEIVALIGPNGSGKTTFINAVTGMLPMDGGSIVVSDNVELSLMRPQDIRLYGLTRTFQSVRIIEQISVLDNVLLVVTERNVWGALFERHTKLHLDAAQDALKRVGLWEKRDALGEELSYGQRKLLEMARAIATRAQVYFFDEPFAGLFPQMREIVSEIMRELKASNAAVVLVEHDMDVVRSLADRCYVLDSGTVVASGTPEKVLADPDVIAAYLGK